MMMLKQVASELEALKCIPVQDDGAPFPSACRSMLYSLPGNDRCMDCSTPGHHQWASVSFGGLLCISCSGRHRGLGVQTSFVRSVDMDTWTQKQVLAMLEGGNEQLQRFFERHHMMGRNFMASRYMTKAALFYRTNLKRHIESVSAEGLYKGREAARRKQHHSSQSKQAMHNDNASAVDHHQQQQYSKTTTPKRLPPQQTVAA